jgi:hypothetical protein
MLAGLVVLLIVILLGVYLAVRLGTRHRERAATRD